MAPLAPIGDLNARDLACHIFQSCWLLFLDFQMIQLSIIDIIITQVDHGRTNDYKNVAYILGTIVVRYVLKWDVPVII